MEPYYGAVEATIQERKRVLITGESKEIYTALTPRIFTYSIL